MQYKERERERETKKESERHMGESATSRRAGQLTAPINRPIYCLVCASSNWNYAQLIDSSDRQLDRWGEIALASLVLCNARVLPWELELQTNWSWRWRWRRRRRLRLRLSLADNCRQLITLMNSEQNLITSQSQIPKPAIASLIVSHRRHANTSSSIQVVHVTSYENNLHK